MTSTEIEPARAEAALILESERSFEPQAADVRARAFARARAAMTAHPLKLRSERRLGGFHWLAAAAVVAAAATVWAAKIHAQRSTPRPRDPETLQRAASSTEPLATTRAVPSPDPVNSGTEPGTPPPLPRPSVVSGHGPSARALYALELKVLQPAQVAVAAAHFTQALSVIAEHARRFPNGQLAEEREALRVEALAGLHHTEQARRAAAAFGARFPGSVLLPSMNGAEERSP